MAKRIQAASWTTLTASEKSMKKIVYATTYDPADTDAWSGSGSYILKSLQSAGFETDCIGNLKTHPFSRNLSKLKQVYYGRLFSKTYLRDREPSQLRQYAAEIKQRLSTIDYDLVFSPGTLPIAYLDIPKPIVFWADATFGGMVNFYPGFRNLSAETIRQGNEMEQSALSHCQLAIYTSDWAAKTALQNYQVDPAKVKVVPFGANLPCDRTIEDIDQMVDRKSFDQCQLLFLGVEWQRKGGDIAIAVAEQLNRRGIETILHVVGCNPPFEPPSFVKLHGYISKKTAEGVNTLAQLMSESHCLILPSQAECYGVVFAEASSFGLPSLATQVGGIPTAIHQGKNGWTFPLDAAPEAYCDCIERLIESRSHYRQVARSTFQEYTERLNWQSAGQQVRDLIQAYCG
ncbi:glycosyltransferase family 4 protein [Leptolyngbya sp. AN03gr2]|uniref:glycosyltransferase family 4 protein n=1 Tax=unclassified Leptolyngbya TaxID=2650499 RepID=UPI003D322A72